MYPEYCRDTFTRYVTIPRDADFRVDPVAAVFAIEAHRPDIVLLASPNNPTGTPLDLDVVRAVLDAAPGMVVVDEAYAEFRRSRHAELARAARRPPAPGRDPHDEQGVRPGGRTARLPRGVAGGGGGGAARAAAVPPVRGHPGRRAHRARARRRAAGPGRAAALGARRPRRRGCASAATPSPDSDANFVLFGHFDDRHAIWQGLLDRGVLIRETGPEAWLRVSVGTPEENAAFRAALEEVTA